MAVRVGTGEGRDPHGGRADLEAGVVRAVRTACSSTIPLRLLRAVRLEDELRFRMDERTEGLVRSCVALVVEPAGERILSELRRLSLAGYLGLPSWDCSSRSEGRSKARSMLSTIPTFAL